MATNKKPPKHKQSIPPLVKAKLEATMREENLKARRAGAEYGILAMKVADLMFLGPQHMFDNGNPIEDYIELNNKVKEIILSLKPITELVDEINKVLNTNYTLDDLVALDSSLGQYM